MRPGAVVFSLNCRSGALSYCVVAVDLPQGFPLRVMLPQPLLVVSDLLSTNGGIGIMSGGFRRESGDGFGARGARSGRSRKACPVSPRALPLPDSLLRGFSSQLSTLSCRGRMDAAWAQFRPTRCSATAAMLSSPHPSLLSGHGPKFPHSLHYSALSFRVGDTRYTPTAHGQGSAIRAICSGPTLYCVMREFCPRRYEGTPTSQDDTDMLPAKRPNPPFSFE